MVSKVFSGHSFYHAYRYIVNKPGAEVLECEGVRGHDFKVMSDDFIIQQQLRPEKEKACFHCSLSFYPGEKLSDEQMVRIAKDYLEKMKITNTQHAITKHTDRRHIHLHVVANMVDNDGRAISDSFVRLRGKKTAQQLTQQYHLVPALSKNLKLTNYQALSKSETNKYQVYETILKTLPQCKNIEELKSKLQLQGIETQYKYKGQTQEKQGVSFKIGEDCFKGSQVDRQFSLSNLEKTLELNQKQSGELKQKYQENTHNYPLDSKQSAEASSQFRENVQDNFVSKGIEKSLDILLRPEENIEQTLKELLNEDRRRKKKQSQRLRH